VEYIKIAVEQIHEQGPSLLVIRAFYRH